MFNKISKLAMTLASLSMLTSCATIMHGSRQNIGISSNPSLANVWVDGAFVGNTPLIVNLTRRDNHYVHIELEGYQPFDAVFTRHVSGWVFGNVVFGGVIGLAVDAITGGIYCLTPDQVQAELRNGSVVMSKQSDDSYIAIVMQPDPSWKKVGNLVASN